MLAALKGLWMYEDIDEKLDGLRLLLAIKGIVYMFQSQNIFLMLSMNQLTSSIYSTKQE